MTNEEAKVFLDNLKICIDEHPIVADWLVEIADRKTEPQYDAEEVAKDINRRVDMVKKDWNARHIEDEPLDKDINVRTTASRRTERSEE